MLTSIHSAERPQGCCTTVPWCAYRKSHEQRARASSANVTPSSRAARRLHLFPDAIPEKELVLLTKMVPLHPWHPAIFRHFGCQDHFAMRGQLTSKSGQATLRKPASKIFRTMAQLKDKLKLVFHLGVSENVATTAPYGTLKFSGSSFSPRVLSISLGAPHFPLRLQEPYRASQLRVTHLLALGRKNLVLPATLGHWKHANTRNIRWNLERNIVDHVGMLNMLKNWAFE